MPYGSDPVLPIHGYGQDQELTAGPMAGLPPINMNREVGSRADRAIAGLKFSTEGKAKYLEEKYGVGNVATGEDGTIYIKDKGEFVPFDSPSLNTKDVYDASGLAVAVAPALLGEAALAARAPGMVAALGRGAGLSAVGSAAQQAAGAATPGGDPMTPVERLGQLGLDAGSGVVGEAVGRGVSRAVSGLRNVPLKQLGYADTPVAREGEDINTYLRQGFNPNAPGAVDPSLTRGQVSQRKSLLTLEGTLRRSPTSAADKFQAKDTAQLTAARQRFDDLVGSISRNPYNAEILGQRAAKAFDDTVGHAMNVLDKQGAQDFAFIDKAAGSNPVFPLQNTGAAINELITRYDVPGAMTDTTKGVVRQLSGLRDALIRDGKPVPKSAAEMQRLLSSWGRGAQGAQTMFGELDKREATGIAKRVFGALNDDLDAVATSSGPDSAIGGALQKARNNYRQNFGAITELRKSAIGQYLGFREQGMITPEHIAERLAGMKPSALRQTFALIDTADPELAGTTKRFMLERAMDKAEPAVEKVAQATGSGVTPEAFSPATFVGELSKSPVFELLDPNEKLSVNMLNATMKRLANRAGTEGSPTGPLLWAKDIAVNLASALGGGDVMGALKVTGQLMGPGRMADIILSPRKTSALMQLTSPKLGREAAIAAATTLGLMSASRAGDEQDVRPFSGLVPPGSMPLQ